MLYQKKNLRFLVISLLSHRKLTVHRPKKTFIDFAKVVCINGMIPALLSTLLLLLTSEEEYLYWTFGQKFGNPIYRKVVILIGMHIYITVSVEFLCDTILSICGLIKHCRQYILQYSNNLKRLDFHTLSNNHVEILNDYYILEKNILHLKEVLSVPSFLILSCCFFNLYAVLSYGLEEDRISDNIIECVASVFVGIAGITLMVIYSSQIPENMMKIKGAAGHLIEKYQLSVFNGGEVYCTLDRIEKKEVIYLSAWGVVDFKKSFLLTASGALLTYGLLFIQLKVK
ncbi:hypothetical protein AVEN_58029-1 [Araneus ventricosus]|uniref:Gustatory receptor n=1 Tax=Araneus ventricosus TaxID=182803 RepID=A0A4Y2UJ83_ARAVE|nr:hypothetical protein AVEN_266687-1 [Araneus ventricosus]GBO12224.1 hypothetical protein AVEN_58029-1 [Araneus ventricosus]